MAKSKQVALVNDCDPEEQSTDMLIERFRKHVAAVNFRLAYLNPNGTYVSQGWSSGARKGMPHSFYFRRLTWHMAAAIGIRKLLVERALTQDDDRAGDAALGAPHWLTYSETQLTSILGQGRQHAN